MSYQVCPLCKGTGIKTMNGDIGSSTICSVCNGQKIISQLTGKPPVK